MKTPSLLLLAAPALLLSGSMAAAQIQPASHSVQSCPGGGCETGICCQAGGWNSGQCQCCNGNSCQSGGCLANTCLGRCCATKAYPDAGWAAPARLPVNRDRAWYQNYSPQAWYGSADGGFVASYPQVYQPTDTTELGYYYGNVPTWQTRPGMIPPTPNPAGFHSRTCPSGCQTCQYGGGYAPHSVYHGYAQQIINYPTQRPQIVRPQIARDSGARSWFRLSALSDLID